MKNKYKLILWISAMFLMLISINVKAQNPTYNCRITNAAQVSCNEYEFDVTLARTGTTILKLAMFQLGITIDPAIIPSGGVINVYPVPGSSSTISNPAQRPGPAKFSYDPVNHCIIVTAVSPPGYANGSTIITGAGNRLFRLRVACSLPFVAATNPNHTWSFDFSTGYQSKIFAYVGTINTDITVQASHTLFNTYNPVFTGGFPDPLAQTVTSDVTQVCLLPGAGAIISLAATQAGYTYYLYIDGVLVPGAPGVLFGTGSTASFSHLVQSGIVSVKSISCTGQVDMLNTVTITTVTPLNATVSILAVPGNVVIPGTSVTYTATPANGGTTPTYQWYVNGVADDVNGLTETYIYTPTNGDQLYCEMTSSETCVTPALSTSNTITMVVAFPPAPFAITGATSYCQGTGGVAVGLTNSELGVTYTLYKNTVAQVPTVVGTGAAITFGNHLAGTYTVSGTNPGGTTVMTGSLVVTETPSVPVSVAVAVDQNNLCSSIPVTFTATPTNGGTPAYQWYMGTTPVGANQDTYTLATPANGNQVHVVMTSNVACAIGNPATSSNITIVILPTTIASVSVSNLNNVCAGTSVTYTATPTNGGTPTYQWYVNSTPTGTNSTYSYVPANGDQVYCVMTSTVPCVTGSPATSSTITMVTNPVLPVSVSSAPDQNNICGGTSVTFTASPTNGGTPTYQWYVGTTPVGTNSPTYTYVPTNGNQVHVVMTSSLGCVSGNPATSSNTTMNVTTPLPVSAVVAANPAGIICINTMVTFTATPTNGGTPTYQWYVGTNQVGLNQNSYAYMPANGDQVKVVMTSNLSCISGSPATSNIITEVVNTCIGIEDNLMDVSLLNIYPNPTNDKLFVNFSELKEVPKSMRVINALGQQCFQTNAPLQANQNGIDVSQMSAGTYTLQIVFDNEMVNKSFIVKK